MFTIVCESLSAPNRHENSYNSSCPNREKHSWDGRRGLHVLKSCLVICSGFRHVPAFPLRKTSHSSSVIQFLLLCFGSFAWDLNRPNNVWITHLLMLPIPSCVLWLSSKRICYPGQLPPTWTGLPHGKSLLCQRGHRWMPSYKSNQRDNVLLSQEWTLMTKSPA